MTIFVACWVYIRLCVLMLICYFQLSLQKKIVHLHPTYLNFTFLMLIMFSFSVDQLNYVFKVQKFIHPFSHDCGLQNICMFGKITILHPVIRFTYQKSWI